MSSAQPPFGLVVPVYDEIERLTDYTKLLVDFVAERGDGERVFVGDGSTDGTPDELDHLIAKLPGTSARVLRTRHAGKGAAVTAGLRALDSPCSASATSTWPHPRGRRADRGRRLAHRCPRHRLARSYGFDAGQG